MLKALPLRLRHSRGVAQGNNWFNARPIGSALFNPRTCRGSPPAGNITRAFRPGRIDDAVDRLMWRHALTLIVSTRALSPRVFWPKPERKQGCVCACTHYLVFREPTADAPSRVERSRTRWTREPTRPRRHDRPCLGEPFEVTSARRFCQRLFPPLPIFARPDWPGTVAHEHGARILSVRKCRRRTWQYFRGQKIRWKPANPPPLCGGSHAPNVQDSMDLLSRPSQVKRTRCCSLEPFLSSSRRPPIACSDVTRA